MIDVHCRCQNWNRCAACGESLSTDGLRVRAFVYQNKRIWHVPGFSAFGHTGERRCPFGEPLPAKKLLARVRRLAERDDAERWDWTNLLSRTA